MALSARSATSLPGGWPFRRPASRRRPSQNRSLLLGVPPLVLFGLFIVAPIGVSILYSLTDWDGTSPNIAFVGLDNYVRLAGDSEVVDAFLVTFSIAIVASLVMNVVGLPLAVLLNHNDFVTRLYRSAIFYPLALSAIVVSFLAQTMLSTEGVLNALLGSQIAFLGEPFPAVLSIMGVSIWHILGFTTVMYLAGVKSIPDELYEASLLDGATAPQRFRYLTLPLLGPTIAAVSVLIVVYLMRIYEYVLVITLGGPAGATQTVAFVAVQTTFDRHNYSYGSTMAVVLLAVVFLASILMLRFARRMEY
jgi:ABC-type sugar transport system permease subunit